jgi:hypothetical protein
VETVTLDFGVVWRDVAAQSDAFPEELIALAAKCRLGLELSHYPVAPYDRGRGGKRKRERRAPHNNQMQRTAPAPAMERRR